MQHGEFIKDPAITYETALLMPELCTTELDLSQYMVECLEKAKKELENPHVYD